jgi:hypothetical protein
MKPLLFWENVDFDNMRVRELKRYLISKLGASKVLVEKIVDKKELKKLANDLLNDKRRVSLELMFKKYMNQIVIILILLVSVFLFRSSVYDSIQGYVYVMRKKIRMLRISIQNFKTLTSIALVIVLILDVYEPLLHLSAILRWILPQELQYFRIPALSLSPSSLFSGSRQDESLRWISGFDFGPMLTLWILRSIKGKLEIFSSRNLLPFIDFSKPEHRPIKMKTSKNRLHDTGTNNDTGITYIFPEDRNDKNSEGNQIRESSEIAESEALYEKALNQHFKELEKKEKERAELERKLHYNYSNQDENSVYGLYKDIYDDFQNADDNEDDVPVIHE